MICGLVWRGGSSCVGVRAPRTACVIPRELVCVFTLLAVAWRLAGLGIRSAQRRLVRAGGSRLVTPEQSGTWGLIGAGCQRGYPISSFGPVPPTPSGWFMSFVSQLIPHSPPSLKGAPAGRKLGPTFPHHSPLRRPDLGLPVPSPKVCKGFSWGPHCFV